MLGTLLVCASLLAVDGDNIKCDSVNMRDMGDGAPNVPGYDTPEVRNARCQVELELGRAATAAMDSLLNGASVYDSGTPAGRQRSVVASLSGWPFVTLPRSSILQLPR